MDLEYWKERKKLHIGKVKALAYFLILFPEFRSVFYFRLGKWARYLFFYLPPRRELHIWTKRENVGGGLYIGHGWSTVINAKSIGVNCLVGQNCTIGSRNLQEPIIGDNVCIWGHVVCLGAIVVGDGAQLGAGSVVVKSVPPNAVVVPSKSQIIRINGETTNILL